MNSVSGQRSVYQATHMADRRQSHVPSMGTRILAVASAILLSNGGAFGALPAHPRLQGGVQIAQPDFASLSFVRPQFGPFLSPELNCDLTPALPVDCLTSFGLDAYVQAIGKEISPQISPYVDAVKNLEPVRDRNAGQFPENLSAFVINEVGLVENGKSGCELNKNLNDYAICKPAVDRVIAEIKERKLEKEVFSDHSFRSKGRTAELPLEKRSFFVRVGLNPQIHANYKKALDLATEKLLQDECFFRKDHGEVLNLIRELHVLLLKDLPALEEEADGILIPGEFRRLDLTVYKDDDVEKDPDSLIAHLKTKRQVTDQEIKRIHAVILKMLIHPDDFVNHLSSKDRAIWEELAYFPPHHGKLKNLMENYARDLKSYALQEIHPIALASWALAELGRIHPFLDGNGRVGRIVMNGLLVRGGYEPVVIPDDAAYTQALSDDLKTPGAFAIYLAKLIKAQSKGPQVLMHAKV